MSLNLTKEQAHAIENPVMEKEETPDRSFLVETLYRVTKQDFGYNRNVYMFFALYDSKEYDDEPFWEVRINLHNPSSPNPMSVAVWPEHEKAEAVRIFRNLLAGVGIVGTDTFTYCTKWFSAKRQCTFDECLSVHANSIRKWRAIQ